MKSAYVLLLASCLASCQRFESVDPQVQLVLDTGQVVVNRVNKCIAHIKMTNTTNIPECKSTAQMEAYNAARLRVTTANIPALNAMQEQVELAKLDGLAAVMKEFQPSK